MNREKFYFELFSASTVGRIPTTNNSLILGSGCGSVGGAVASNTRGLQFEFILREKFIQIMCLLLTVEKTKIKEAGNGQFNEQHF